MRIHVEDLPQIVLSTKPLDFEIGHKVQSVPKMYLEDDNIIYCSPDRPDLSISNTRAVFYHIIQTGLALYESTGLDCDIIIFDPKNPLESSRWDKQTFRTTAERGYALYEARDREASKLTYLFPETYRKKRDEAEGEVWLEIHVEFRAGPGETVIGQRRRINKNTGEIELGQTFVQPIDVALASYAELGRAIDEVLNPTPDPEKVVSFPATQSEPQT